MTKQIKNAGACWDKKDKATKVKMTTRGYEPENTGKRRQTKKISRKAKIIETNQDIPKQQEKNLLTSRGDGTKNYQQLDAGEAKQFWRKIWQPRENNEKAEWKSHMGKKLEWLEVGPKVKILIDPLRTTMKIYQIENTRL